MFHFRPWESFAANRRTLQIKKTQSTSNTTTNQDKPKAEVKPTVESVATQDDPTPITVPENETKVDTAVDTTTPTIAENTPSTLEQEQVLVPVSEPAKEEKIETPATSPTPNAFEVKLCQLEEMGFSNKELNIQLLINFKGDLLNTVKALLDN